MHDVKQLEAVPEESITGVGGEDGVVGGEVWLGSSVEQVESVRERGEFEVEVEKGTSTEGVREKEARFEKEGVELEAEREEGEGG